MTRPTPPTEPLSDEDYAKLAQSYEAQPPTAEEVVSVNGVTGIYPGGVQWAVCRHDLEFEDPTFMRMDDEQMARDWYRSLVQSWEQSKYKLEIKRPELVAARIHWVVQE